MGTNKASMLRRRGWLLPVIAAGAIATSAAAFSLAVFTDSAGVGANTFSTGTVDVATSPTSAAVTFSNMAPGDSVTDDIVVSNSGTLALRYALASVATNTDAKGLKDQLVLTIRTRDLLTDTCTLFDGTQLYSGDLDSTAGNLVGDSAQGAQTGDRTLAAGASERLCFRVSLPSSTGNAFQNATTTATFTFSGEQTVNNP